MALTTDLITGGLHHALSAGNIVAGATFGEVAGVGAAQLCQFLLPYDDLITVDAAFEDQCYVTFQSTDGNVTAIALNATPFIDDPTTGLKILQLDLDVAALPAAIVLRVEAHHSAGR